MPTVTGSAGCSRPRWSAPSVSSTPRPSWSVSPCTHRVTTMATPADEPPADEPPEHESVDHQRNWQELVATALLVVAALATSWSSYQATRWNGEQAAAAGRTSAIRIEAARAQGLAQAETQVDVATFIAWAEADQRGDTGTADFFRARFRDEFRPAYDAWVALEPATNASAPATPFALAEYQVASRDEAERLDTEAEASAAEVRVDIQRSGNYVLTVVLYAVVLFFAGMSTRLTSSRLRWVLTLAGCAVLVATLGWIATFPVSLSV